MQTGSRGTEQMSTVYVVGLGPGAEEQMTVRAQKLLEHCPVCPNSFLEQDACLNSVVNVGS